MSKKTQIFAAPEGSKQTPYFSTCYTPNQPASE